MCGICIAVAYVDAMHMFSISLFLSFLSEIRKKVVQDLPSPPTQRHLPSSQHVVPDSSADDTICCVISLTCDASRRGGKQRYDYFLSVIHFRKPVNNRKIGSAGNGPPAI
uniref:hypothetical protein n=1 Tax=Escherichia coli TaxID=562 RepID=UPI003CC53BA4